MSDYTPSGTPATSASGSSSDIRAEFALIQTAIASKANATNAVLVTPNLGTASAGVLTNCTGLPVSTGISGLGTGVANALAVNIGSAGAPVTFNGAGGTPSSMVGTNITGTAAGLTAGAVAVGGITGLGTGVAAALAVNVGSPGAPVVLNGAAGTPSSGTLTNCTGLPVAGGGTGRATSTTAYGLIAAGTTAIGAHQTLAAGATTEILVGGGASALPVWTAATGSGAPVRATSPTLVAPALGVATATSVNSLSLDGDNSNITIGTAPTQYDLGTQAITIGSGLNSSGRSVAIGHSAQDDSSSGNNVVIGYAAKGGVSGAGGLCVAIGGSVNPSGGGVQSTAVGSSASASHGNSSAIGYQATSSGTNTITLGNSSIATLRCQVTSITALSDARDKTDIKPLYAGLPTVMKLNPVRFTWNMRDGGKVGIKDAGFIAQDLQTVDDEYLRLVYAENPDKLEASYGRLIPVLVKAIQDLKAELDTLRGELLG